jgi:hypothetical protein
MQGENHGRGGQKHSNNLKNSRDMIQLLLERRGGEVTITEGVLKNVVGHWRSGAVMEPLFEQRGVKSRSLKSCL